MKGMSFATDSTPSDNSLSPLTDDTKVDDEIIITSPNKSRTTEDLFAMIHRCVSFGKWIFVPGSLFFLLYCVCSLIVHLLSASLPTKIKEEGSRPQRFWRPECQVSSLPAGSDGSHPHRRRTTGPPTQHPRQPRQRCRVAARPCSDLPQCEEIQHIKRGIQIAPVEEGQPVRLQLPHVGHRNPKEPDRSENARGVGSGRPRQTARRSYLCISRTSHSWPGTNPNTGAFPQSELREFHT